MDAKVRAAKQQLKVLNLEEALRLIEHEGFADTASDLRGLVARERQQLCALRAEVG